jgi:hypothetical protein
MRLLQNILLVVGATVLGAVAFGVGLAYAAAFTIFRPRPGQDPSLNWGGAAVFTGIVICGGVLGAIVGFSWALRRIAQRSNDWSLFVWGGVLLGFVLGAAMSFSGLGHKIVGELCPEFDFSWESWAATGVCSVVLGTLGGIAAAVGQRLLTTAAAHSSRRAR